MRPSLINVARFQNKVRAIFGVRGENPIPDVQDMAPNITVESDRPEWEQPGGDLLWTTFATLAAVAAEVANFLLFNPPGSGLLQILTGSYVNQVGTPGFYYWTRTDPATIAGFDAQSVLLPRDARAFQENTAGFPSPIGMRLFSGNLNAAEVAALVIAGVRLPSIVIPAGSFWPWEDDEAWVIPEGFGFGFSTNTVLLASQIMFQGRQHIQERGIPS